MWEQKMCIHKRACAASVGLLCCSPCAGCCCFLPSALGPPLAPLLAVLGGAAAAPPAAAGAAPFFAAAAFFAAEAAADSARSAWLPANCSLSAATSLSPMLLKRTSGVPILWPVHCNTGY